ncbi:hypothetical protein Sango_0334000 [Sesamum angolense]|uniref:SHSP domain-containing protein n=1 Tax=Sesamum angolense TaxID=2727404 RepID=A0AAE1X937_9LAMI|nr:hypothetical protein Sango_0334000 [Sesamum angolense]
MDASTGAAAPATNSFEPTSDLIHEEECDTLLLYLPGFTKEQLRVQLTRSGILKISGIRPVGDNKWSSFQKDFPVSANCDTNKITAKFEGGILYLRQPKLIVPADKEDTKTPPPSLSRRPRPRPRPHRLKRPIKNRNPMNKASRPARIKKPQIIPGNQLREKKQNPLRRPQIIPGNQLREKKQNPLRRRRKLQQQQRRPPTINVKGLQRKVIKRVKQKSIISLVREVRRPN